MNNPSQLFNPESPRKSLFPHMKSFYINCNVNKNNNAKAQITGSGLTKYLLQKIDAINTVKSAQMSTSLRRPLALDNQRLVHPSQFPYNHTIQYKFLYKMNNCPMGQATTFFVDQMKKEPV